MQRNTITELGKLHIGDRFAYLKRTDPWQVMDTRGTKVAVNQVDANGNCLHRWDDFKSPTIQVRFLRHTHPLPHEECYVNDLQIGDVFYNNDMIVLEWEVVQLEYPYVHVRNTNAPDMQSLIPWNTVVTFVRKPEVVS